MQKMQRVFCGEGGWKYINNKWIKNGRYLSITITVNSNDKKRLKVVENIKQQLEGIGINVNIREVSENEYKNILQNKNYQIIISGIYNGLSPDLTYFYGEGNIANYKNEDILSLLKEVKNITDEKTLKEKYERIIRITSDECAYIGLYRNKASLIVDKGMSGNFEPNNYSVFNNFETWNREK